MHKIEFTLTVTLSVRQLLFYRTIFYFSEFSIIFAEHTNGYENFYGKDPERIH